MMIIKRLFSLFVATSILFTGSIQIAQAAMVSSEQVAQSAGIANAEQDRQRIYAALSREAYVDGEIGALVDRLFDGRTEDGVPIATVPWMAGIRSIADALQYISYYHPVDYIKNLAAAYEREY